MQQIIKKPLISEKSYSQTASGKFSFLADPDADKGLLREMVEELFKVNVIKINSSSVGGKIKRVKGKKGKRNNYKKFVVTLKTGQKIDLFEVETEEKKDSKKPASDKAKKDEKKSKKEEKASNEKTTVEGVTTSIKKVK